MGPKDEIAVGGHFPVLDGIRGIAVLRVTFLHFLRREDLSDSRVRTVLYSISRSCETGVHLFFVISRFLITGILLDSKRSACFLRKFQVRRIFRIFPLHCAARVCLPQRVLSLEFFRAIGSHVWESIATGQGSVPDAELQMEHSGNSQEFVGAQAR